MCIKTELTGVKNIMYRNNTPKNSVHVLFNQVEYGENSITLSSTIKGDDVGILIIRDYKNRNYHIEKINNNKILHIEGLEGHLGLRF